MRDGLRAAGRSPYELVGELVDLADLNAPEVGIESIRVQKFLVGLSLYYPTVFGTRIESNPDFASQEFLWAIIYFDSWIGTTLSSMMECFC